MISTNFVFQVMPPLTLDQVTALREDIERRGVLVPVVIDQHGRVLDGHNRLQICRRLGIDPPLDVRHVADDDEARELALTLNLARRHISREQRRDLIRVECEHRPDASDREIARLLGCSPSTVAAVRRPVSNLDTPTTYEPPDDVDIEMRERVLDVYDDMNLTPELPTSDAAERWVHSAFIQDSADAPLSLMLLLTTPSDVIDDAALCVAIVSRMALWRSVGISRAEVRGSLMPSWLDLALSPSSRARFQGDETLRTILDGCADEAERQELVEVLRSNLASIPTAPVATTGGDSDV